MKEISKVTIRNELADVIEHMRQLLSGVCFRHGAISEDTAYELDIDVDGTMGLSELEKIKYLTMYKQEGEGIIWIKVGGICDNAEWHDFDSFSINELYFIIENL